MHKTVGHTTLGNRVMGSYLKKLEKGCMRIWVVQFVEILGSSVLNLNLGCMRMLALQFGEIQLWVICYKFGFGVHNSVGLTNIVPNTKF